jgi:hypothetical protein
MSSLTAALIIFACIFGGALFGLFLRVLLPDHHLRDDSRDVVKLGAGLIATLAALVLGLLISSAKSSLDTMNSELTQSSAKIIVLDRALANYGPETKEIRDMLHRIVVRAIEVVESREKTSQNGPNVISASEAIENIQHKLQVLVPRNDSQRLLQTQALQIFEELTHARWLLIEQAASPLPKVFLAILVFWLIMLFVCFGLLASHNMTVVGVLLICALSVSGAIFLILEMNTPITGIINVSSVPLRKALDNLGK